MPIVFASKANPTMAPKKVNTRSNSSHPDEVTKVVAVDNAKEAKVTFADLTLLAPTKTTSPSINEHPKDNQSPPEHHIRPMHERSTHNYSSETPDHTIRIMMVATESSLLGFGGLDDNLIKGLIGVLSVGHILSANLIKFKTRDQV
jgi:hypothetical protein